MDKLTKVLAVFNDKADLKKSTFMASFFSKKVYTNSYDVKIDIVRGGRKVAPVLKDQHGKVLISAKDFTTKKFTPPLISLSTPCDLAGLMDRRPGETEYAEVGNWQGRLFNEIKDSLVDEHMMISERLELMASQIMQTGVLTLTNESGNTVDTLDFSAKSTHFPQVITTWGTSGATPLADIEALCNVINNDGKRRPSIMLIGSTAWHGLLKDSDFEKAVRKDGMALGGLDPEMMNNGAVYQGYICVGSYRLDMYTYDVTYENLTSDTQYNYLAADSVVITAARADLDFRAVFAGVPTLGMKDPFRSIIPSEIIYENGVKVINRVYEDEAGDTFQAESKARPILIPVSIDRFGCIKTTQA